MLKGHNINLEFHLLSFICHIAANTCLVSCKGWKKSEYLVKNTTLPKVTGNFFTCPGQDLNLGSVESIPWQCFRSFGHQGRPGIIKYPIMMKMNQICSCFLPSGIPDAAWDFCRADSQSVLQERLLYEPERRRRTLVENF